MWSRRQIEQHERAAKALGKIKDEFFCLLKPGVSEYEAAQFIQERYEVYGLWSDHAPIVAFGNNTSHVHYFAGKRSLRLKKENMILLDIWARVRERSAPFADMTWMGLLGSRVSRQAQEVFGAVIGARDEALRFLRREVRAGRMPTGREVDAVAREFLGARARHFPHSLGHSLGFHSPHGKGAVLGPKRGNARLGERIGYTIEPGVYLKGKFGVRSEIDFYIDGKEVVVTTPVQKVITRVLLKNTQSYALSLVS